MVLFGFLTKEELELFKRLITVTGIGPKGALAILGTLSVLFSNALAAYATAYALVMNNYALLALQITSRFKGDVQTDAATGGALAVVLIALMVVCTLVNNYFTRRAAKGRELV